VGSARKLINKTSKLSVDIKNKVKGRDRIDRIDETLANSISSFKLIKNNQRRFDESFGKDYIAHEPELSFEVVATSLTRVDFDEPNEDYGISLTLPSGLITAAGLMSGDEVVILEGSLEGRSLEVLSVSSTTVLRLDDVATFNTSETDITVRFNISS